MAIMVRDSDGAGIEVERGPYKPLPPIPSADVPAPILDYIESYFVGRAAQSEAIRQARNDLSYRSKGYNRTLLRATLLIFDNRRVLGHPVVSRLRSAIRWYRSEVENGRGDEDELLDDMAQDRISPEEVKARLDLFRNRIMPRWEELKGGIKLAVSQARQKHTPPPKTTELDRWTRAIGRRQFLAWRWARIPLHDGSRYLEKSIHYSSGRFLSGYRYDTDGELIDWKPIYATSADVIPTPCRAGPQRQITLTRPPVRSWNDGIKAPLRYLAPCHLAIAPTIGRIVSQVTIFPAVSELCR